MQVDHPLAAGLLVQAVHVLGDQRLDATVRFQHRRGVVGRIGARGGEARPAGQAARPVASPGRHLAGEGLEGDRLRPLPATVGIAVVGNAGRGAAAGTGEHEQPAMAREEFAQRDDRRAGRRRTERARRYPLPTAWGHPQRDTSRGLPASSRALTALSDISPTECALPSRLICPSHRNLPSCRSIGTEEPHRLRTGIHRRARPERRQHAQGAQALRHRRVRVLRRCGNVRAGPPDARANRHQPGVHRRARARRDPVRAHPRRQLRR